MRLTVVGVVSAGDSYCGDRCKCYPKFACESSESTR